MATNFDLDQMKINVEAAKAAGKLGPFITQPQLLEFFYLTHASISRRDIRKLTNLLNEHYEKRIDKLTRPRRTW